MNPQNALTQALNYIRSGVQNLSSYLPQSSAAPQATPPAFITPSPKFTANAAPTPSFSIAPPQGGSFVDYLKNSWQQAGQKAVNFLESVPRPGDQLPPIAKTFVDPLENAARYAGAAFVQTPVLGLTGGKTNIPFYSNQELQKISGPKNIIPSAKEAASKLLPAAMETYTAATQPLMIAGGGLIGAASKGVENILSGQKVTKDLQKGIASGMDSSFYMPLLEGFNNAILGKILPSMTSAAVGETTNAAWNQVVNATTRSAKLGALKIIVKNELLKSLVDTPVIGTGFGLLDYIKNDRKLSDALIDNVTGTLFGNVAFRGLGIAGKGAQIGASRLLFGPTGDLTPEARQGLARSVYLGVRRFLSDPEFQKGFVDFNAKIGEEVQGSAKLAQARAKLVQQGLNAEDAGNVALAKKIRQKIVDIDSKAAQKSVRRNAARTITADQMPTTDPSVAAQPAAPDVSVTAPEATTPTVATADAAIPSAPDTAATLPTQNAVAARVPGETAQPPIPPTPAKPPASSLPKGTKERGFVTTVKESPTTSSDVAPLVEGTYKVAPNKKSLTDAQKYIDQVGWDEAKTRALGPEYSAETSAVAQELMRRAQNEGRPQDAADIANAIAIKATKAGQFNQAFSIWSRLTPEGMLQHIAKQFKDAEKNMDVVTKTTRGIFGKKMPKLDGETTKIITELMKKAQKATTEKEKSDYVKQVFDVVNKKLPWSAWDLLDEYRYNNMLSNPITHLKNLAGNLLQSYAVRPATLAVQGKPIDAIKYEVGALGALPRALVNAFTTFKEGKPIEKLDQIDFAKYKPSRLPKILSTPSRALTAADEFFSTIIQGGEKARGTTPEAAHAMAKYTLFNQDLKPEQQGMLLNKIDDVTRAVYGLRRVGLGWFIPFIKVPMNVAKQWIEYSPAGVATLPGAQNKKEQLAKALIGSMVTVVGAKMAMEGRTTWAAPTDPKEKAAFYDTGRKPFSVNIDGYWVPMQAFGPAALSLALPAAYKYFQEESRTAPTDSQIEKLTQIALSGLNFWSQQTFVSGLGSFVNVARGDVSFTVPKTLAYTATQAIPFSGLMRYLATALDPVYRQVSGDGMVEQMTNQIKSGLPWLSHDLPAYTDANGDPSVRNWSSYVFPYALGENKPQFEDTYRARQKQLQLNNIINRMKKGQDVGDTSSFFTGANALEPGQPLPNFSGQPTVDQSSASLQPVLKTNTQSTLNPNTPTASSATGTATLRPAVKAPTQADIKEQTYTGRMGIPIPTNLGPVQDSNTFNSQFLTIANTVDQLRARIKSLQSADIPQANKDQYVQQNMAKLQQVQDLRAQLALDPNNQQFWQTFLASPEGQAWYKSEVAYQKSQRILPIGKAGRKSKPKMPSLRLSTGTKNTIKPGKISMAKIKTAAPKFPKIKFSTPKVQSAPRMQAVIPKLKLMTIKLPSRRRAY